MGLTTTVYVLDDGYNGTDNSITGDRNPNSRHGTMMCDLVRLFSSKVNIKSIQMPPSGRLEDIAEVLSVLYDSVKPDDVVLFGWITYRNDALDQMVEAISQRTTVVCPAGNYAEDIENYSPLMVPNVIVVHALNHHDQMLSRSNFGNEQKQTVGMYGVPIQHLNITQRGTSVAVAIYAALLSRNKSEKFMRRAKRTVRKLYGT